jgi:hypothetical protein
MKSSKSSQMANKSEEKLKIIKSSQTKKLPLALSMQALLLR